MASNPRYPSQSGSQRGSITRGLDLAAAAREARTLASRDATSGAGFSSTVSVGAELKTIFNTALVHGSAPGFDRTRDEGHVQGVGSEVKVRHTAVISGTQRIESVRFVAGPKLGRAPLVHVSALVVLFRAATFVRAAGQDGPMVSVAAGSTAIFESCHFRHTVGSTEPSVDTTEGGTAVFRGANSRHGATVASWTSGAPNVMGVHSAALPAISFSSAATTTVMAVAPTDETHALGGFRVNASAPLGAATEPVLLTVTAASPTAGDVTMGPLTLDSGATGGLHAAKTGDFMLPAPVNIPPGALFTAVASQAATGTATSAVLSVLSLSGAGPPGSVTSNE